MRASHPALDALPRRLGDARRGPDHRDVVPAPPPRRSAGGSRRHRAARSRSRARGAAGDACPGRDVLIRGDRNNVTLHGGCRSVTVQGDGNQVQAELQPAAPITLNGADNDLAFVLVAPGPDPLVTVTPEATAPIASSNWGRRAPVATPGGIVAPGGGHVQVTEMPSVRQLMQDLGAQETPRGTLVTLHDDVLFDFDKANIRPDAAEKLTKLGQLIAQMHPSSVSITGYTDSIGTAQYNIGLSMRRAESVERWLRDQDHVRPITAWTGAARPTRSPRTRRPTGTTTPPAGSRTGASRSCWRMGEMP